LVSEGGRLGRSVHLLKRFLQRHIETQLARALISGAVTEGNVVKFTVKDDELVMK
jgi:ATP-dependent Clp protease ATP-binding subunit ClpA